MQVFRTCLVLVRRVRAGGLSLRHCRRSTLATRPTSPALLYRPLVVLVSYGSLVSLACALQHGEVSPQ